MGRLNDGVGPGQPQADTSSLVTVAALTEDMLLTHDGAFLVMLEMPPFDTGFSGQDFNQWAERYEFGARKTSARYELPDIRPAGTA